MSETANSEATSTESEKPVHDIDDVKFPPFPDPIDEDFEDDIIEEEKNYYKTKFSDLNTIKNEKLHCTACDRHLGCSARNDSRMRSHPMLRTLVCHTCHSFYNSGEFEKGDDGSELYCRWCGQGGQVYCCSSCPIVFCAKCIKRNFGLPKIKEIENTDDWKCFKCNSKCLWDLRAVCWALLRYCDLKNKITYSTTDQVLKEKFQKNCASDESECCRNKNRRKEKADKKKDAENSAKKAASIISKIPPTIQVKKFASINLEESSKQEKKPQKRPASPKTKFIKNPLTIPCGKLFTPISIPPLAKKMRMTSPPVITPVRIQNERSTHATYARIKPRPTHIPYQIINNQYNGYNNSGPFNNMVIGDNINLSLESLTQGLDMTSVAQMAGNSQNDDVVCTPDFPLEPLCEVTEENPDDDVQCMTPGPIVGPKVNSGPPLPPLIPRSTNTLSDLSSENIIQMTENDVTVNAATGGLKFRVDPQTLSSNKMYRLPDGRIFAINANPNMPGGYSATIVAVTENTSSKILPKTATYAAKLSAVPTQTATPPSKSTRSQTLRSSTAKRVAEKPTKVTKAAEPARECDLHVPVEWFRYNLIDAIDTIEYSLSRLKKLKKEATTMYLRTRNVSEMRNLHKNLDRILNTSSSRFGEIRENLSKEMKQFVTKKTQASNNVSDDDDDDVEILNDLEENDDPIFIDENSVDSNVNDTTNGNDTQEVDLTVASNELNNSGEKSTENDSSDKDNIVTKPTDENEKSMMNDSNENEDCNDTQEEKDEDKRQNEHNLDQNITLENENSENKNEILENKERQKKKNNVDKTEGIENTANVEVGTNNNLNNTDNDIQIAEVSKNNDNDSKTKSDHDTEMNEDKTQDGEMSEEMIETLLKEDSVEDDADNSQTLNSLEVPEELQKT